jgi:hypothetical protein
VKAKLLTIDEVPTGWSIDNSGDSGHHTCLSISDKTKPKVKAEVDFTTSDNDSTTDSVGYFLAGTASAALARAKAALDACPKATLISGAETLKVTIGQLSFPNLGGDEQIAYQVAGDYKGYQVGGDLIVVRTGDYLVLVGWISVGQPDVTAVETFARAALAKAEGKPITTTTTAVVGGYSS